MPKYVNENQDALTLTSTSTAVLFGFSAEVVRFHNDASKSVYLTLAKTTGATTSGHELKSSEEILLQQVLLDGFAFVATSSGGGNLRYAAWGM